MANELQINERESPMGFNGDLACEGGFIARQAMSPAGTSSQSSAFNAATKYITLYSSLACYYKFGSNPTAVADGTSAYLPANVIVRERVRSGEKIAVIT